MVGQCSGATGENPESRGGKEEDRGRHEAAPVTGGDAWTEASLRRHLGAARKEGKP